MLAVVFARCIYTLDPIFFSFFAYKHSGFNNF